VVGSYTDTLLKTFILGHSSRLYSTNSVGLISGALWGAVYVLPPAAAGNQVSKF